MILQESRGGEDHQHQRVHKAILDCNRGSDSNVVRIQLLTRGTKVEG